MGITDLAGRQQNIMDNLSVTLLRLREIIYDFTTVQTIVFNYFWPIIISSCQLIITLMNISHFGTYMLSSVINMYAWDVSDSDNYASSDLGYKYHK